MTEPWAIVISAFLTAVGGLGATMVASFKKMRNENREDHGNVMKKLGEVSDGINSVSERLNNHIDWHLEKE